MLRCMSPSVAQVRKSRHRNFDSYPGRKRRTANVGVMPAPDPIQTKSPEGMGMRVIMAP
jgi:hypothetical protein